ncbi:MAG: hypothetical protein V1892_00235 [bacterium]
MEAGISGMIDDKFIRVKQSLHNHQKEIKVIERKLDNPQVPDGKKDKLIFRYFTIVNQIIPKLNSSFNSYF